MSQAVKVAEKGQRLAPDEVELVEAVSINMMIGQHEISANQMRKLARLAARLRKKQKLAKASNTQQAVKPSGDENKLTQPVPGEWRSHQVAPAGDAGESSDSERVPSAPSRKTPNGHCYQKLTNPPDAKDEVTSTGDGGNFPEIYDMPDVTPRRDEDQSTQAG